jgi:hypothetical protein
MVYNSSLKASTGPLATSIDILTAFIDASTASTETDTLLDFSGILSSSKHIHGLYNTLSISSGTLIAPYI